MSTGRSVSETLDPIAASIPARLAVAMKQYEMENGDWPDSFDALAPKYLENVPLDPSTDEPFQMEQVDGGLRLYSATIEAMEHPEWHSRKPAKVELFLKSRSAESERRRCRSSAPDKKIKSAFDIRRHICRIPI